MSIKPAQLEAVRPNSGTLLVPGASVPSMPGRGRKRIKRFMLVRDIMRGTGSSEYHLDQENLRSLDATLTFSQRSANTHSIQEFSES